ISCLSTIMWIIYSLLVPIVASASVPRDFSNPNTKLLDNIRVYIHEEASPCEDYHQYACGKYATKHSDDPFTEITQMLDHKMNQKLVQVMDELEQGSEAPGFNGSSLEAKVLRFYINCRDAPDTTRKVQRYLRLVPPDVDLSWPQFSAGRPWPKEKFNWMETLARLHRYGLSNVLISAVVTQKLANRREFIVDLGMPIFTGENDHLKGFLESFATLLSLGVQRYSILPLIRKMRKLENSIQKLTDEEDDDEELQFMTLRRLESITGLEWRKYYEIIVDHQVPLNREVQVKNLKYFRALKRVMDAADKELVANYIMTRFIIHLTGDSREDNDPIECMKDVRRSMNLATNFIYQDRFLAPETLRRYSNEMETLFDHLRRRLLKLIDHNHLRLTAQQRRFVSNKAKGITINIGNVPKTPDLRAFADQYYKGLEMPAADKDYNREHLKLLAFKTRKWMEQLNSGAPTVDEYFYTSDSDTLMSSSPFYILRENQIIMPFGLLQEPLFVPDSHNVFKYSLMGFVLAHELTHAIDGEGIFFNTQGNVDLSVTEIVESPRFQEGMECMNRNKTDYINERLADITGLHLAYGAYFNNETGTPFQVSPREFNHMSQEKIFFLNLAQFFCGDADASNFLEHDEDKLRLVHVLSGFPPFDRAFGCRRSSSDKCRLW
ncbi:hypothetical protein KR067_010085, partial [Drosophila pandora]